jgi:hypothetical protein
MCVLRTTYLYRSFQFQKDRLVDEDLASLCAQVLDLVFLKLHRLARTIPSYCNKINKDLRWAMIGWKRGHKNGPEKKDEEKEEKAAAGGVGWRRGEVRRYGTYANVLVLGGKKWRRREKKVRKWEGYLTFQESIYDRVQVDFAARICHGGIDVLTSSCLDPVSVISEKRINRERVDKIASTG